ncbi:cysteine hydrolase [Halalkalibacter alkaliphilus]|uniref:Cysteine hydrolase n=1 Tax=Halalkalibacter alkaliphilus TaxID=2917993 RepID=A0A9X1ZXW1_9BACI|nr:cysteine hydrolase [Halalkalibacter alkaliphilus]MCL7745672.1 cysteine hydrolase [Halalkalibacter alkaliphilus]
MTYDPNVLCQSLQSALVVIDMQNDFVANGGAFSQAGFDVKRYQALEPVIYRMIVTARENKIPIIFVAMTHNDGNDGNGAWKKRRIARKHPNSCREGTWGVEPYGRLHPTKDDVLFYKHRYSAFTNDHFNNYLSAEGIETLVFTGINTNTCVESTIRDAHMKDYHVVLVKDATTCAFKDAYLPSITNIERHFGAVISSGDWLAYYSETGMQKKYEEGFDEGSVESF